MALETEQERPKGRMGRAYYFTAKPGEIEVARLERELPDQNRRTEIKRSSGGWLVEVTWDPS